MINGMRMTKSLFIILLFISFNAFAQTPNIGFEDGTFNHWDCFEGTIDSIRGISLASSIPVYNRHTIYGKESATTIDQYGGFPVLCPNGSKHSIKLGNEMAGGEAERVSY